VHELGIYLHARRYRCEEGKWDYETGLPDWALPPPGYEGPTESTEESDPLAVDLKKLGLEDDEPENAAPTNGAKETKPAVVSEEPTAASATA
jgi:tRNA pseudouridine synthase 9